MSKAKAPAFQLYAGDFLTDVMDWTDEEVGVHIRLLCWSWVNRKGIPRDIPRVTRIAPGADKCWKVIGEKWSEGPDDTWVNNKLEGIRSDSDAFRAKQREKSILGVEKRRSSTQPAGQPVGSSTGQPVGDPLEGEEEDITSKRKERAKSKSIDDRKSEFITKCAAVVKSDPARLPDKLRSGFFEYWTEPTQDGKGMRFEAEKYFDHSRRMATWKANAEKRGELVKEGWNPRA